MNYEKQQSFPENDTKLDRLTDEQIDHLTYADIDEFNGESWFLTEDNPVNSRAIISLESVGKERISVDSVFEAAALAMTIINGGPLDEARQKQLKDHVKEDVSALNTDPTRRTRLAGNMSPLGYGPSNLSPEERADDARLNMDRFIRGSGLDPKDVLLLSPSRDYTVPMEPLLIDELELDPNRSGPTILPERSDFIVTYDPKKILGVRPADCPVITATAETPKGPIYMMIHFAWEGAATPGRDVEAMMEGFEKLGVDNKTVRMQMSPGGQGDTYKYNEYDQHPEEKYPSTKGLGLFTDLKADEKGTYSFGIDTPLFVYKQLLKQGFSTYQIFPDTTSTSSLRTGNSSNTIGANGHDNNNRDLVLFFNEAAQLERGRDTVLVNPNNIVPPEILKEIVPVSVEYVDMEGKKQTGEIEVNKAIADSVELFFAEALTLGFPIEHVVKSSNLAYQWNDEKLMADNATSGFNYRLIKGSDKPSLHGRGLAFDVNTRLNPYFLYDKETGELKSVDPVDATYNPEQPGTLTANHPLVMLMKERGFTWGGDWTTESGRQDFQHFELDPDHLATLKETN